MEHALSLRGIRVVSEGEATILGRLHTVYVDGMRSRVAAIGYRTRWLGDELFVGTDHVVSVTPDHLSIENPRVARRLADDVPEGPSLLGLLGARVTTTAGRHLGRLADVMLAGDWTITELLLDNRQRVPLSGERWNLGEEIVVPAHCAARTAYDPDILSVFLRSILRGNTPTPSPIELASDRAQRLGGKRL